MTNEKQGEADAKLPTTAQEDESTVKNQPDETQELTNKELAATVAGAGGQHYVKYAPDD
jgi:hypothetical protein